MKLRNKKTGKILDFYLKVVYDDCYDDYYCENLKDFTDEWEDI